MRWQEELSWKIYFLMRELDFLLGRVGEEVVASSSTNPRDSYTKRNKNQSKRHTKCVANKICWNIFRRLHFVLFILILQKKNPILDEGVLGLNQDICENLLPVKKLWSLYILTDDPVIWWEYTLVCLNSNSNKTKFFVAKNNSYWKAKFFEWRCNIYESAENIWISVLLWLEIADTHAQTMQPTRPKTRHTAH